MWSLGPRDGRQKAYSEVLNAADSQENDVVLTGYVEDDDLPAVYAAGPDAFVFPSLYEGFGLPPLEAMACGTPVITSNTSSLPEVVGDAGIMVDPLDVKALADAIERVVTDDTLRSDLRARGIERPRCSPGNEQQRRTSRSIARSSSLQQLIRSIAAHV